MGRKAGSALRMVIAGLEVDEEGAWDGVEGTSPCRLRIMFWRSISAKTG